MFANDAVQNQTSLAAIFGALGVLLPALWLRWSERKKMQNDHEIRLKELETQKEIALAEHNTSLQEARDKHDTLAFSQLKEVLDEVQKQVKVLKEEHKECHTALSKFQTELHEVRMENRELKIQLNTIMNKV